MTRVAHYVLATNKQAMKYIAIAHVDQRKSPNRRVLDFDGYLLAGVKHCAMHLSKGCCTDRVFIDRLKHFIWVDTEIFGHHTGDCGKGNGSCFVLGFK